MTVHLFAPILAGARLPGRLAACMGAALGIALTAFLCARLPLAAGLPTIVAPLGASAVLVFAVPASPLAQPWAVIGGNTLSALVGVAAFRLLPGETAAAAVAVGGAMLAMSLLRCLHPPGGAAALTAVIGGAPVHAAGFGFAFAPVAVNSLLLVALGVAFGRLARRSYPHRPAADTGRIAAEQAAAGLRAADVDAALADMREGFDIARADLDLLLARAEAHALRRRAAR